MALFHEKTYHKTGEGMKMSRGHYFREEYSIQGRMAGGDKRMTRIRHEWGTGNDWPSSAVASWGTEGEDTQRPGNGASQAFESKGKGGTLPPSRTLLEAFRSG